MVELLELLNQQFAEQMQKLKDNNRGKDGIRVQIGHFEVFMALKPLLHIGFMDFL